MLYDSNNPFAKILRGVRFNAMGDANANCYRHADQ
jgi:hypothetical protein